MIRLTVFFLFFVNVACKKEWNKNAIIIEDCTGKYLRLNEKDYKVCNKDAIAAYSNGSSVEVTFKKINKCNEKEGLVCYMIHEYESWVEIIKIK